MRQLIHISAALLFALLSLAAVVSAQRASGSHHNALSLRATRQTPPSAAQENIQGDGVRRITPAEVRAALEKGEAVIVDVRGQGSYEAGHVKGALSIPFNEILSRTSELPRDKMIITYCS
jgi:3-mercaptopyruvate sulfurtransferase SseA